MFRKTAIAFALVGATALTPVAFAAAQNHTADQNASTSADQQASQTEQQTSKDFQKLSEDGFQAFRNVQLARLAIFEGQTDQAKQLVDQAATRLQSAKTDGTAFETSHTELMQQAVAGQKDQAGAKQSTAKTENPTGSNGQSASNANGSDQATLWLPIDGQVLVGADYQEAQQQGKTQKASTSDQGASQQKDAMAKANQAIQSGDKKTAREQLKLAGVDVDFAVALVPLDQVTKDVGEAQNELNSGKYYEASQDLRKIQEAIVVAAVDEIGVPDAGQTARSASNGSSTATPHDQQAANGTAGQMLRSQQPVSQTK